MPGHFLVQEHGRSVWCDPFFGGVLLDRDGCEARFRRSQGPTASFHPAYLAPTSPHGIVARMLTNLEQGPLASEPVQLDWMLQLHLSIPDLGEPQRTHLEQQLRTVRAHWN